MERESLACPALCMAISRHVYYLPLPFAILVVRDAKATGPSLGQMVLSCILSSGEVTEAP